MKILSPVHQNGGDNIKISEQYTTPEVSLQVLPLLFIARAVCSYFSTSTFESAPFAQNARALLQARQYLSRNCAYRDRWIIAACSTMHVIFTRACMLIVIDKLCRKATHDVHAPPFKHSRSSVAQPRNATPNRRIGVVRHHFWMHNN